MNILQATQAYARWSARQVPFVPVDLRLKHQVMTQSAFSFFRATCYRWMQVCPEVCTDFATAPVLKAVADLHVENFGTWRDSEGRLIWGINDFDEACEAVLSGYQEGMQAGGRPFVRLWKAAKAMLKATLADWKDWTVHAAG